MGADLRKVNECGETSPKVKIYGASATRVRMYSLTCDSSRKAAYGYSKSDN